jgi:hypothetical protein
MKKLSGEWKFLAIFCGCVVGLIAITGILAPARQDNDPTPSTWNSGRDGAKAAWLLLGELGYKEVRWERPEAELARVDARHATLVLAQPSRSVAVLRERERRAPFEDFLRRGGRIVATGEVAPLLLPYARVDSTGRIYSALCETTPEGPDALARAGSLRMLAPLGWARQAPRIRVAQRCGGAAVVVSYPVSRGEVIWWASATPLTNRGLRQDGNLRLLLASVGGRGRTVYFDEYMHGIGDSPWSAARGTPLTGVIAQACLVAALLLFSFGRGTGPRRALVQPPRTSPLEFVESMGALYARAGASSVAVSAALRRLTEFLGHEGGIPRETLRSGPEAVAAAVAARFGGDAGVLASDLEAARQAPYERLRPLETLKLVRRLDQHIARLRQAIRNPRRYKGNA